MATEITSTGVGQTATTAQPNALKTLSDNYQTFLKLLTEQLKNQDPMQPQDASEFTNQLVQFSQVEQQIASNDKLDALIGTMNQNRPVQALSYMGKVIEMQGNGIALQEGKANLTVTLPSPAASATVEFYDNTGLLVHSMSMPKTAGYHDLSWDGKSASGKQLQDGFYQVAVKAKGSDGEDIATLVQSTGVVTGVDMSDGNTYLVVGVMAVKPENVLSIRNKTGA
ncbi:flagellar hook assembly protein FlgD [Indioceanicola profundi]|uniref:flagellar hook assembly protein FlgD n=1 Tax=Indioceanicola profundi TaxID=2220096 RepID=UPI000E6AB44F|nr:flagellar hook assembly protein FlgD [Indioceanicola profundi]